MATIVQQAQPSANIDPMQSFGIVKSMIGWFSDNFFMLALLCIILFVVVIVLIMFFINEENKRQQEDMLYKEFKNTISSCEKNREDKMYTTHWSKWNLLWLGFPILHYKIGRKIFDKRQNVLGFYDGMYTDDLDNMNILTWKDKTFFFFKNYFVIRLPTKTFQLQPLKQTKKQIEAQEDIKYEVTTSQLPKGLYSISDFDLTVTISIIGLKKYAYYYYPIYADLDTRILNLQESINAITKINHSDELLLNVIKEGGKAVLGMAKQNTNLVYEQRAPDKVKDVQADEKG